MPYHETTTGEMKTFIYAKTDYAAIGASALGALFMSYLTYLHFHKGDGSALCDFGGNFSCQIVNQSVFSEILGIPVSVLGLTYFLAAAALVAIKHVHAWRIIQLFTVFSLVFSAYLSGIEYLWLGVICLFCELSKVLMVILLAVSTSMLAKENKATPASWIFGAIGAGLAFTGIAFLLQR
jgi:uncharacterized membrane protein